MLTEKCSFSKRISAFLIDLFAILLTSLVLNLLCVRPLMNHWGDYDNKQDQLVIEKVKSYLFVLCDADGEKICDGADDEETILSSYRANGNLLTIRQFVNKNEAGSSVYLGYLTLFYDQIESDTFVKMKGESGLFDGDAFDDSIEETRRLKFCESVFEKANRDIGYFHDGIISTLTEETSGMYLISAVSTYGTSALIFFLIIPMCGKYRQSIGKRILHLGVVNRYYVPANFLLMTCRVMAFLILEVLLGMFTFGIPLILSVALSLILKSGQCLHDAISTTQVLDLKRFLPFENLEEYRDFIVKEKEDADRKLRKAYED